jgi:uncharacterized Tic20 family protein
VLEKINVIKVFEEHFETLKKYNSDSYSLEDIFLFIILPAILAYALIRCNISLTNNVIIILVTSFSIFAALLFNLLLLIYDIVSKSNGRKSNENNNDIESTANINEGSSNKIEKKKKKNLSLKEKLLKQTYVNISFNITISIISITFLLILYLMKETIAIAIDGGNISQTILSVFQSLIPVLSFFIYYFLIQFMLTLFMILKRIHVLLSKEFE